MNPSIVDRDTFLRNLRVSKLLTGHQLRVVNDKLANVQDTREMAKALASWKVLTKFQAKMLLVGRNGGFFIGPYKILDLLGQGGMGRVYKALHQTMNRTVALKVLSPQVVKNERARELFLREVQAAAQLTHPNIVMAFDANEYEGRHYLAMEYVNGPNLDRYVKDHGPLPIGLACEIAFQTANGLQHAHERGMVHRDIKPANLLLQEEPGSDTVQVKILDFGLARLHHEEAATTKTIMTPHNVVMGTPDYLSPEQSKDLHKVDIRSDLYSLGCTFYFLLTSQVPFPGGNTVDKLIRHHHDQAPAIEKLRPTVPPPVADIVRKLLAKSPADRYQTPNELMDALAPLASPSVMDWPVTPPPEPIERDSQEFPVLQEDLPNDTEPRAQASTKISDEESILEWVDQTRRKRRLVRRAILAGVALLGGLFSLIAAVVLGWILSQQ